MSDSILTEQEEGKEFIAYGLVWPTDDQVWIERQMIRNGGEISLNDEVYGRGTAFHVIQLQKLIWPDKVWHRWNKLIIKTVCEKRMVGIMGPGSSGKTHEAALLLLTLYFCFPNEFTGMVSSTDVRSLELRVWGEIKKYWALAKEMWPDCPGHLIESRQMIVTSDNSVTGRDFRNGLIGIPCVVGGTYVGLGKYVGVKNKHIMLCADELSFMGKALMDSVANLNKNKGFKMVGMGNPKDPDDALGTLCKPHADLGGWEGVEQGDKTRIWATCWRNGACIQLVGTDSPNFDSPANQPEPYPFLIGREEIQTDLDYYGPDSLQFQMMDLGVMPRGAQSRRVITTILCDQCGAGEKAYWGQNNTILLAGVDASYTSIGGDRTIMIVLRIGKDQRGVWAISQEERPLHVQARPTSKETVEDQIAYGIKSLCEARGIPANRLFLDSTGRGTLVSALGRLWSPDIQCVEFGGKPTDRIVSDVIRIPANEHFTKFVSELWFFSRYVIEARQMRQMTQDVIEEGSMREWCVVKGNRVEVEEKRITKKRMGKSPDIYDAFVVAIEGARRSGFMIQKLSNMDGEDAKERQLYYQQLLEKKQGLHKGRRLDFAA